MTEKLQLRLRGVNICDRRQPAVPSYRADLIEKLQTGFRVGSEIYAATS